MNDDSPQSQISQLKAELARVETDLRFLRVKADLLEEMVFAASTAAVEAPPSLAPAPEPVMTKREAVKAPPVIIPSIPFSPEPPKPPLSSPLPPPKALVAEPVVEPESASIEMKLGTYWFVRVGVVMVLTALVFLGNYAYQHYISLLGPVGKILLMYGAGVGLLSAGAILPRRHERLKNYGQVLFGGGLAAVYFTTYAAHHFANLRVIANEALAGTLLLGWTAFMAWLADRKKSESMALVAIGLAYYSALITNVGSFTLVSNLLLSAAAVWFLIRNRWVTLTFVSLLASYGSFLYWRFYVGGAHDASVAGQFSVCGYWAVFTAAVFLTKHELFVGRKRASFLTFNNGAAFGLMAFSLTRLDSAFFWQLSLGAGTILLALSACANRLFSEDKLPERAYLAQGIFLVTLGLITKLSGPTLALVLAMESALLLVFSTQWSSRLLKFFSIAICALAAIFFIATIGVSSAAAWFKAIGFVGLLSFCSVWASKHSNTPEPLRPLPLYYAVVAFAAWLVHVIQSAGNDQIGLILAMTTLVFTGLHYAFRARELTSLAQVFLFAGQIQVAFQMVRAPAEMGLPAPILIAISLGLSFWFQRQRALELDADMRIFMQTLNACAAAAILYLWAPELVSARSIVTLAWILTASWLVLGCFSRNWAVAGTGQIFLVGATLTRLFHYLEMRPASLGASVELIAALVAFAALARWMMRKEKAVGLLRAASHGYQWLAALMALFAVLHHAEAADRFIWLAGLFAVSLAAAQFGGRHAFGSGLMLAGSGAVLWLALPVADFIQFQNIAGIGILLAAQFTLRRYANRLAIPEPAHNAWIATCAALLLAFTSRWVVVHSAGYFYLTASWALLAFALFVAGFALRERAYRWSALAILTLALGRVMALDVWKLETLYRVLSFLALGCVLLTLGYVYTRYQEKIAKWL